MNSVNLIGNLANDWEFGTTENGKVYGKNSIAVRKDKDNAIFIPLRVWGGTVEIVEKYTKKGDKIGVSGYLDIYKYKDDDKNNYYTFVVMQNLTFCERR